MLADTLRAARRFYKYTDVDEPAAARQWQLQLCRALGLTGRIHVAGEGINGTVGGCASGTALYTMAMERHAVWGQIFGGIDFKSSAGDASAFPNLFIKCCTEIIALGRSPAEISWRDCGQHLEPAEFHRMLLEHAAQQQRQPSEQPSEPPGSNGSDPEDLFLLDCRNMYGSLL